MLDSRLESRLPGRVQTVRSVGGGSIADSYRVHTSAGDFFLKTGPDEVARTFEPEAAGLRALRESGTSLRIPEVVDVAGATDSLPGFLLMRWIETGSPEDDFWDRLGRGLAEVHRYTSDRYGFEQDNFIGRLPQRNQWLRSWSTFFVEERLEPQVRMAREKGRWNPAWNSALASLYRKIRHLLPDAPEASLLHGDLWSGNFMVAEGGTPALIDPAAYYGHREADLALTELFGGFERRFYDVYGESWPLEPRYEERKHIYNLYHLINHLNHFGSAYSGRVEGTLRRFGA